MKIHPLFVLLISLLTLQSCQRDNQQASEYPANTERQTPTKMIEYLVGQWQIDSAGNTTQQGQGQDQRMIFTQEARYMEYLGNQKVDSGAYRMNEQLNNLYLESEINANPREFEIKFDETKMTLKPKQGNQTMTFRRIGPDTSPQN